MSKEDDSNDRKLLTKKWKLTAKQKHLALQQYNPEYNVHIADLRFAYYPLKDVVKGYETLPLSHYWEEPLSETMNLLTRIHEMYAGYSGENAEFNRKADLGYVVTMSKNLKGSKSTNQTRLDLLNKSIQNKAYPAIQRNFMRYNQIEQLVKHSLTSLSEPPLDYNAQTGRGQSTTLEDTRHQYALSARMDYNSILIDLKDQEDANFNYLKEWTIASVQYHIAELDMLGLGTDDKNPDYASAKSGFISVLKNEQSHPFTKAFAQIQLQRIANSSH